MQVTIKVQGIGNTAHWHRTHRLATRYVLEQENQPADKVAARHYIFPQMAPYMP